MKEKNVLQEINQILNKLLLLENDYRGEHSAPGKDGKNTLDNLEDIYPNIYNQTINDFYNQYVYSDENLDGYQIANLMVNICKGKPNKLVKIYRAVPDLGSEYQEKIKLFQKYLKNKYFEYNMKFTDILRNMNYEIDGLYGEDYKEYVYKIYNDLIKKRDSLRKELKINAGDWVTVSKPYAVEHGKGHLNNKYVILSKTVPCKNICTNGDSVFEQGYCL
jgi:hypothetical protein